MQFLSYLMSFLPFSVFISVVKKAKFTFWLKFTLFLCGYVSQHIRMLIKRYQKALALLMRPPFLTVLLWAKLTKLFCFHQEMWHIYIYNAWPRNTVVWFNCNVLLHAWYEETLQRLLNWTKWISHRQAGLRRKVL